MIIQIVVAEIVCALIAVYTTGALQQLFAMFTFIGIILLFSIFRSWIIDKENSRGRY